MEPHTNAAPLAIEVGRAIEWIRSVRRDGASWEVLPRPTRPELYPNTGAGEDQPWSAAKRRIADSIERRISRRASRD